MFRQRDKKMRELAARNHHNYRTRLWLSFKQHQRIRVNCQCSLCLLAARGDD